MTGAIILTMLAATPPATSGQPFVSEGKLAAFHIPDEVAPAVVPYMKCRLASLGVPVYAAGKKALIPPPRGIGTGSDCDAARAKAAKDADRMLARTTRWSRDERAGFIEEVLVSIDRFDPVPPLPPRLPRD